jgi:hypothetical protein
MMANDDTETQTSNGSTEVVEFLQLLSRSSHGSPTARAARAHALRADLPLHVAAGPAADLQGIEAQVLAAERLARAGDLEAAQLELRSVIRQPPTEQNWAVQSRAAAQLDDGERLLWLGRAVDAGVDGASHQLTELVGARVDHVLTEPAVTVAAASSRWRRSTDTLQAVLPLAVFGISGALMRAFLLDWVGVDIAEPALASVPLRDTISTELSGRYTARFSHHDEPSTAPAADQPMTARHTDDVIAVSLGHRFVVVGARDEYSIDAETAKPASIKIYQVQACNALSTLLPLLVPHEHDMFSSFLAGECQSASGPVTAPAWWRVARSCESTMTGSVGHSTPLARRPSSDHFEVFLASSLAAGTDPVTNFRKLNRLRRHRVRWVTECRFQSPDHSPEPANMDALIQLLTFRFGHTACELDFLPMMETYRHAEPLSFDHAVEGPDLGNLVRVESVQEWVMKVRASVHNFILTLPEPDHAAASIIYPFLPDDATSSLDVLPAIRADLLQSLGSGEHETLSALADPQRDDSLCGRP